MPRPKVYVLCMHSFGGQLNHIWDFTFNQLETMIADLTDKGFTFVRTEDVISSNILGEKNILLSLDDSRSSNLRAYETILRPRNIKPLLAVTTEQTSIDLTWQQLRDLQKDGCYIAAHGHKHLRMSSKLFADQRDVYMREIIQPKLLLEAEGLGEIQTYVYPYGEYTSEIFQPLAISNYSWAFTCNAKPLLLPLPDPSSRLAFLLPRYILSQTNYLRQLMYIRLDSEREKL